MAKVDDEREERDGEEDGQGDGLVGDDAARGLVSEPDLAVEKDARPFLVRPSLEERCGQRRRG